MKLVFGVLLTLVALAGGGVAFVYSGVYDVAASNKHSPLGQWATHTTMHHSVESAAEGIAAPDLSRDDMVAQGARSYEALCTACHLKPGLKDTVLRTGLNPTPPDLTSHGHWGAAEQFWIVKHGIKMTGMPAWGQTHGDEELWEIVAFLQRLPELSEEQYNDMLKPSDSSSGEQAGDGHDHEHDEMSSMAKAPSVEAKAEQDDGHDHEHGNLQAMTDAPVDDSQASSQDSAEASGEADSTAGVSESAHEEGGATQASTQQAHDADGHSH